MISSPANITTSAGRWRRRRRAAALIEMVLVIPLLATVIGLTFLFGWAMTNRRHVQVSSRYTAWRTVRASGGIDGDSLNSMFFADEADNVSIAAGQGPTETLTGLIDAAAGYGQSAEALTDAVVSNRCPRGVTSSVSAHFPSDVGLWQQFEGSMVGGHARDGRQWRRADRVNCHREVRDEFFSSLDGAMAQREQNGSAFCSLIRELYLQWWRPWRRP